MISRPAAAVFYCLACSTQADPWRLQDQVDADWLTVSGEGRYRVEVMDDTFRPVDPGDDQMTTSRLLLAAEARGETFYTGFELQDSRAWWHDERTPVSTADVNAGEFLQAYVGARVEDLLSDGDELRLKAGRMDISMGNKRIVARNGYRNTINGFLGGQLDWRGAGGERIQAFYTRPLERLPDNRDRDALRDNEVENDQSTSGRVLWGLELSNYPLTDEARWDGYLVGFDESDRPSLPARKRDHLTLGGRLYDFTGPWQWEIEAAWQWGEARATPLASDTDDLDHRAGLLHAEVSYGFADSYATRLFLKYDYATGDSDPTDGKSERFDTLFAARSRDFGLLGIFGPLFYSNLNSPAVGVKMRPSNRVRLEAFYRPAWLAEKRSTMIGAPLVDRSGESGSFVGHQYHIRADWDVIPGQISLMAGAGYLDKGEFLQDAPRAPDNGDTVLGVAQVTLKF